MATLRVQSRVSDTWSVAKVPGRFRNKCRCISRKLTPLSITQQIHPTCPLPVPWKSQPCCNSKSLSRCWPQLWHAHEKRRPCLLKTDAVLLLADTNNQKTSVTSSYWFLYDASAWKS